MSIWWDGLTLHQAQNRLAKAMARWALEQERGSHTKAAERLGVHRNTFTRAKKARFKLGAIGLAPATETARPTALREGITKHMVQQSGRKEASL